MCVRRVKRVKRAGFAFACSIALSLLLQLRARWLLSGRALCRSLYRPLPSHQPLSQQSPVACKFRSASSGSEKAMAVYAVSALVRLAQEKDECDTHWLCGLSLATYRLS